MKIVKYCNKVHNPLVSQTTIQVCSVYHYKAVDNDFIRDPEEGEMSRSPPPEKLRQTWAALAPSKHKTHYVTSPHSAKPRRWPPDTCGMAFEKLILTRIALRIT